MKYDDVLRNLCYYDGRNPDGCEDDEVVEAHSTKLRTNAEFYCTCDNCFYGRTVMALEIVRLRSTVLDLKAELDDYESRPL